MNNDDKRELDVGQSVLGDDEEPPEGSWSVEYDRALDAGFGAFEQITIYETKGIATSWLTANVPPRQEIGFFRTHLPVAEVDRIRALVRSSDYLKHGHSGPMSPDTPTMSLREGDDVSTFIPGSPRPPAVVKVFDALDEIGAEIRNHPYKVLRAEAKWAPVLKRGEHLEIKVLFRCVGTEFITPDNPLGSTNPTWAGLDLLIAKDKPQAELDWEKDVKRINLTLQDLLTADGKLARNQPRRVELKTGAEHHFVVRRKVLLPEDDYTGSLTYTAASDDTDHDGRMPEGTLTMDLGRMRVTR